LAFGSIGKRLDVYDVMAALSLGLIGYGLWLVWIPLTFIIVGSVLFVVALAGARNREPKR
jgi:TctA family transporter